MNKIPSREKELLREEARARLRKIPADRRAALSASARELLARQRVWREAKTVLLYAPLREELDLLPLIAVAIGEGKVVGLPRFSAETGEYEAARITDFARDCARGKHGVFEPAASCESLALNGLDLAVVPGVAFDRDGNRLGRGGGHYDRLLAKVAGVRCGAAFDEQMRERIPIEGHDIYLNCILTPTEWVETPARTDIPR